MFDSTATISTPKSLVMIMKCRARGPAFTSPWSPGLGTHTRRTFGIDVADGVSFLLTPIFVQLLPPSFSCHKRWCCVAASSAEAASLLLLFDRVGLLQVGREGRPVVMAAVVSRPLRLHNLRVCFTAGLASGTRPKRRTFEGCFPQATVSLLKPIARSLIITPWSLQYPFRFFLG